LPSRKGKRNAQTEKRGAEQLGKVASPEGRKKKEEKLDAKKHA